MKSTEKVDDFKLLRPVLLDRVKYIIMGLELAPTTHQVHWQGYIVFDCAAKWGKVKKVFARKDMHIEVTKGTHKQNYEYCTKTGAYAADNGCCYPGILPYEYGNRDDLFLGKKQSEKSAVIETLENKGEKAAVEEHKEYMLSHGKDFDYYLNMLARVKIDNKPQNRLVIYVQGKTGIGKTWSIFEAFNERCYRTIPPTGKKFWMDHYRPLHQKILLIDEFNADAWNLDEFKQLIDVYPTTCATKGGHTKTNWNLCFVVSCTPFAAQNFEYHRPEIARRFNIILDDVKGSWLGDLMDNVYPRVDYDLSPEYKNWCATYRKENPLVATYKIAWDTVATTPHWYQARQDEHAKRLREDDEPIAPKRQACVPDLAMLDPNGDGDSEEY